MCGGREGHDVAIGADPAIDLGAELDDDAGRVLVRVLDLYRLVDLQVFDIGEPGARIGHPRQSRRGAGIARDGRGAERCRRRGRTAFEELPAAERDEPVTAGHGVFSSPERTLYGLISIFR